MSVAGEGVSYMNKQVLQHSERFKAYVQQLSPLELEPKKKAILTCNEEKQRALYDGDRKYCFSPFCPLCEARRQVLDVIGLINAGDYLKTINDFEFFAIEVSVTKLQANELETATNLMIEAASRFITSAPYRKFFEAFVRRMHFGYQKETNQYSIHLSGMGAVVAEIARELPIQEMATITRKSWTKFYNNEEFPYEMTQMESFKRVDERALELLYAFSDFTVPPEQLLASEEVFLTFVKAISPIRTFTMSNDMKKLFNDREEALNRDILISTNGMLDKMNPRLYRNRF